MLAPKVWETGEQGHSSVGRQLELSSERAELCTGGQGPGTLKFPFELGFGQTLRLRWPKDLGNLPVYLLIPGIAGKGL